MERRVRKRRRKRRFDQENSEARGLRRWFDGALALALLYVLTQNFGAALERSERQAQLQIASTEARALYDALTRFREKNGRFPDSWGEPKFDTDTLSPLTTRGYYRGSIAATLVEGSVDAYESPEPNGGEFWMEMTLRTDPAVRLLIARSDDAPLGGGEWRDGVFLHRHGKLEQL